MKLDKAYIIDGDVIEKRIAELEQLLDLHNELNPKDTSWKIIARIAELKDLKQHLKPALPIVEESFKAGRTVCNYKGEWEETYNDDMTKAKYKSFNDYFLTKDS